MMATTEATANEKLIKLLRERRFISKLGEAQHANKVEPSPHHRLIELKRQPDSGDGIIYEPGGRRLTFNARMRRLLGIR